MRPRGYVLIKFPETKFKEFEISELRYIKKMRKYYQQDPMFNVYAERVNNSFF